MEKRSLQDISWKVPEETYRNDSALSYSTLARFEREGFSHLDTLFDRVESPSLLFGSCVDTLLTDGEKAFNDNFLVSDITSMDPGVEPIVKEIFNQFKDSYTNINDIPESQIAPIISQIGYQPRWKPETRCKVVREKGQQYYQTMFMAGNRTIVPQNVYNKVFACIRALKDSPQTHFYFKDDDPFEDVERFYQLKFKGELNGIGYRCMADLILVNHKTKEVIPCDLKTSSHREWDFPESFLQWQYQIQARLYWLLIRQTMDKDDYFKDFTLGNYRFIVVNNIDNPIPLVWTFEETQAPGEIKLGGKILRHPTTIGEELTYYLNNKPSVPVGIELKKSNSIEQWFENKE